MRPEIERALELIKEDRPEAMEAALALLQQTVFSFSMRVCGHREDAEDTAQEVLLKAAEYLQQFEDARALAVWLYKVAKNRCLMNRRKSKFAPQHMLSLEELMPTPQELQALSKPAGSTPESELLRNDSARRLMAAVRLLPPEYRLVLVLHDMEGLGNAEIAKILDLREGTVRVRLHRARLFLRKELARPTLARRPAAAAPMAADARCKRLFAGLSDYLDGVMDASLCRMLEEHFQSCEPCSRFLDSLRSTVELCRNCPSDGSAGQPHPAATSVVGRKAQKSQTD